MNTKARLAAIGLLMGCVCLISSAQDVQLQHHFIPGQAAKVSTSVQLNGDSLIGTDNARTNLNVNMQRLFQVQHIDEQGQTEMKVQVQEMRTNGSMNDERFNENLTGERLQQVMFGASEMDVRVNPWGQVQASNPDMLERIGISLPNELNEGGFEFPAFPRGPVKIGSTWDDNGLLIQPNQSGSRFQQGEKVYRLRQIRQTKNGRMAIIEYRKTSDLSGMGMGQSNEIQQALHQLGGIGELQGKTLPAGLEKGFTLPELKIQLQGEIYFNVDYGLVTETRQKGKWSMSADFPIMNAQQKPTRVNQKEMDIQIHTKFLWNRGEMIQQQQPQVQNPSIPQIRIPQPPPPIEVEGDGPIEVQ